MKKIIVLCVALLLVLSSCAPKQPVDAPITQLPLDAKISRFYARVNSVQVEDDLIVSDGTLGSIPISELFEIPYQFDMSGYIDVEDDDYIGIKLTKCEAKVTKDELTQAVVDELNEFGEIVDVIDRGAELGDTVNIDFVGYVDGKTFENGSASGYEMVLGEAGFIDGFEEGIVGRKRGEEFSIEVVFPLDYSEALAGRLAEFKIKINSIKAPVTPVLTDKLVSGKFSCETVDDYLTQVYIRLYKAEQKRIYDEMKAQAYEIISSNVTVKSLPEENYNEYYNDFIDYYTSFAENEYGMSLEDYVINACQSTMDEFYSFGRENADAIVEQELIFFAIANREELWQKLTSADYDGYLKECAEEFETDEATFEEEYGKESILLNLIWEKVISYVIDNAIYE